MGFFDRIAAMMNGELRAAHKIAPIQYSPIGYNNTMVQRPVVGVGNAPQYWSNAFFIGRNSIAGGGTIAGNAPASAIGAAPLNWQSHLIGGETQTGTLTPSRQLVPLGAQPDFSLEGRR